MYGSKNTDEIILSKCDQFKKYVTRMYTSREKNVVRVRRLQLSVVRPGLCVPEEGWTPTRLFIWQHRAAWVWWLPHSLLCLHGGTPVEELCLQTTPESFSACFWKTRMWSSRVFLWLWNDLSQLIPSLNSTFLLYESMLVNIKTLQRIWNNDVPPIPVLFQPWPSILP